MSQERLDRSNLQMQRALRELEEQIRRRYPEVIFEVTDGEDPTGIYLEAIVDAEDLDEVLDQDMLDRLFDIQVEQGLPISVLPLWPAQRVAKELAKRETSFDVLSLPRLGA
jgi:hypothetical protein